jgi:hypothetical protein
MIRRRLLNAAGLAPLIGLLMELSALRAGFGRGAAIGLGIAAGVLWVMVVISHRLLNQVRASSLFAAEAAGSNEGTRMIRRGLLNAACLAPFVDVLVVLIAKRAGFGRGAAIGLGIAAGVLWVMAVISHRLWNQARASSLK